MRTPHTQVPQALCPGSSGRSRGRDAPLHCAKHLPFRTDEGQKQLQRGWVPVARASHLLPGCGLHCSGRAHAHGTEADSLSLPGSQPHGSRAAKEPRAEFSPSLCTCSRRKTQRPHCDCWSHPKLRQLLKIHRRLSHGCRQPGLSLSHSLSRGPWAAPGLRGERGEL